MHLGNQNCALRLDVVSFRSANFRSLNAPLRIADSQGTITIFSADFGRSWMLLKSGVPEILTATPRHELETAILFQES